VLNDEVSELELESGQASKLGGTPNWLQGDETPTCPHCKEKMTFIGQLDSIEHEAKENPHSINALSGKQHYLFGDAGLLFTFLCFECSEPKTILQF
jgi:hypothetical protein